ncbi:hypothetical protein LOK49_LG10G01185 [Camellia lanceoleosa]|uniref:Uncharacterized protein n=1 Tax=Camellia lanceoleosa TaxID=1840588 RepID=A0ACC0GAZ0_9ERIC|nr:hypothetical protein LOK49_LG10G01185 [Camellia lanceoleosa]
MEMGRLWMELGLIARILHTRDTTYSRLRDGLSRYFGSAAAMVLKYIILMYYKNSRGRNYRRQGQMLTLVEYLLLLYRALLPAPVMYCFFLNKEYGSLFSSLMTGLYLTFKLTSVVEKVLSMPSFCCSAPFIVGNFVVAVFFFSSSFFVHGFYSFSSPIRLLVGGFQVQSFFAALKALSRKESHYGAYATSEYFGSAGSNGSQVYSTNVLQKQQRAKLPSNANFGGVSASAIPCLVASTSLVQSFFAALKALSRKESHYGAYATSEQGERKIPILIGISFVFGLHVIVVYWWYWNDDILYPLIMVPPKAIPPFWHVIFIIMVNDTLVRQAAMVLKCILLMYYKNSRWRNYRRQGQMLTLVEYLFLLYRALLPAPVWYCFFLNKEYGSLFSSLMTGLYLTLKLTFVVEKVQSFFAALKALSRKETHYGAYATSEQGERKIPILIGISFVFGLHMIVVYWWYWNDDILYPLIMVPPKAIPPFWHAIFIIMVNDTLVRQAAMVLKCILLMYYKNSRGENYRRHGQMLTLVEYLLLLYRALLLALVWYRFFLNKEYGTLFSSLMTGLYLTFNLTSIVQSFFAALKALSRKESHYGAYATSEQVRERKNMPTVQSFGETCRSQIIR